MLTGQAPNYTQKIGNGKYSKCQEKIETFEFWNYPDDRFEILTCNSSGNSTCENVMMTSYLSTMKISDLGTRKMN